MLENSKFNFSVVLQIALSFLLPSGAQAGVNGHPDLEFLRQRFRIGEELTVKPGSIYHCTNLLATPGFEQKKSTFEIQIVERNERLTSALVDGKSPFYILPTNREEEGSSAHFSLNPGAHSPTGTLFANFVSSTFMDQLFYELSFSVETTNTYPWWPQSSLAGFDQPQSGANRLLFSLGTCYPGAKDGNQNKAESKPSVSASASSPGTSSNHWPLSVFNDWIHQFKELQHFTGTSSTFLFGPPPPVEDLGEFLNYWTETGGTEEELAAQKSGTPISLVTSGSQKNEGRQSGFEGDGDSGSYQGNENHAGGYTSDFSEASGSSLQDEELYRLRRLRKTPDGYYSDSE